jgi:hypothetical protein
MAVNFLRSEKERRWYIDIVTNKFWGEEVKSWMGNDYSGMDI